MSVASRRNVCQYPDLCDHTDFFPAAWDDRSLWTDVQKWLDPGNCKGVHISNEGNAADASADGGVFRTLLFVWD